ncbi:Hypothetical Protein FCC1311_085282 [Hondaea fermentalgiana]|uniref:Uncharacterized protein n=1 Tax=Hondaea fermentalgiana TaxID=2315210 RepID=A0A2R5GUG3_9STRA|nr:Hypothetical Protein FCC1311_085282 [Hondaea fermentalgiana]|eukprot:GBG32303.1 Hypothetical Protein FCC1311_085282 [Hondaea fermentalgiana]
MFAVPFGAVDLAALLVAREKLERALIAETGIAKADPRTGRYSVHIDDEEDVDEVAGTAADENEVHGNNVEKEYAATSPTSMADRRARDLKPAGLDRVLQIRMQSLAVRIMIGLVLRLGLARVRCQLLQLGAQWMSRRADAGVAHANEIYVTDENIVKVSCELSEVLENAPEIFADAANDESKFSKNGTATTAAPQTKAFQSSPSFP